MERTYSKALITGLSKKIVRVNDALWAAILECGSLSADEDIRNLIACKSKHPQEWEELKNKVQKYASIDDAADARMSGADLDDATDILNEIFC